MLHVKRLPTLWLIVIFDGVIAEKSKNFLNRAIIIWIHFQQAASYGKKNGMWYAGGAGGAAPTAVPGSWSRAGTRKQSVAESDAPPPGGGKPNSGRVIRIINNMDHSIQVGWFQCFTIAACIRSTTGHRSLHRSWLSRPDYATPPHLPSIILINFDMLNRSILTGICD